MQDPGGVDGRRRRHRVDQLVAETRGSGELEGLRTAGEHGLGSDVYRLAGDGGDAELAADLRRRFEHRHGRRRKAIADRPGRGQARDATTDDHDFHVSPSAP